MEVPWYRGLDYIEVFIERTWLCRGFFISMTWLCRGSLYQSSTVLSLSSKNSFFSL